LETFPHKGITAAANDAAAFNDCGEWFNLSLLPSQGNQSELDAYAREWVHSVADKFVALERSTIGDAVAGTKGYYNGSFGDEQQ